MNNPSNPGKKFISLNDIAPIFIIAAVALILWLSIGRQDGEMARIYKDGGLYLTINLSEYYGQSRIIELTGTSVILEIADGAIAFIQSDCPDQICVHAGSLSHAGQSAACIPNRVAVKIAGQEVDVIAQ